MLPRPWPVFRHRKIVPTVLWLQAFIALCLSSSCHPRHTNPRPAFYYWRSVFRPTPAETAALKSLGIRRLYVKCFDVGWDPVAGKPSPIATLQCPDTGIRQYNIVPVVFITNQTLAMSDSNGMHPLAENITGLIAQWLLANHIPQPDELQIDCDWTATTKDRYFNLLRDIRKILDSQGQATCMLSATIRLYQCKYKDKTGVPPVGKGLLMCYNMSNLKDPASENSILATKELAGYTSGLGDYPIPLDIAFPLFDWKVLFRNGKYKGLIEGMPDVSLQNNPAISFTGGNRYTVLRDTSLAGYELIEGDMLRDEQCSYAAIETSAALLARRLKTAPSTIILFHLDSADLSKYTHHELENIFHSFL